MWELANRSRALSGRNLRSDECSLRVDPVVLARRGSLHHRLISCEPPAHGKNACCRDGRRRRYSSLLKRKGQEGRPLVSCSGGCLGLLIRRLTKAFCRPVIPEAKDGLRSESATRRDLTCRLHARDMREAAARTGLFHFCLAAVASIENKDAKNKDARQEWH